MTSELATVDRADLEAVDIDRTLSAATIGAILDSVPDSTRRAYAADRERFILWCASVGRTSMPATAETMAEYAHHMTTAPLPRTGRPASVSGINRAMSAIATLHDQQGWSKPGMKGARAVINGYKTSLALSKSPAARTRKATAALPQTIRVMLANLDRSTLIGKREAAMVLLGFATAARVSELVAFDVADIVRADHGLDTSVYRRKVKRFTDNAIMYGSDPATCPVRALLAYVAALAEAGRTSGPLFVRIDRHGRIAPPMMRRGKPIGDPSGRMTEEAASDVVAYLAGAANLPGQWSGHSLRRGFATAARQAGHDKLTTARVGGWDDSSKALDGYFDDVDRVTGSPLIGIGL